MSKNGKTVTSLTDLSSDDIRRKFTAFRPYKKVDMNIDPGDIKGMSEQMKALEGEVALAVADLREAQGSLATFGPDDREIAEAMAAKKIKAAQAYIDEQLSSDTKIGDELIPRRRAMLAYVNAACTGDWKDNYQAVLAVLEEIKGKGILVPAPDNPGDTPVIRVDTQRYIVPANWGLKPEHYKQLSTSLAKLAIDANNIKVAKREIATRSVEEQAEMTLDEALLGKRHGLVAVSIRGEPVLDKEGKETFFPNGNQRFHAGGTMLVDFQPNYIEPIRSSGGLERPVSMMNNARIRIPRGSIWSSTLKLNERLSPDGFKLALRFWATLKNGIRQAENDKRQAKAKADMQAKAEISAHECLGLNGSKGQPVLDKLAFLEFRNNFRVDRGNGPRVYNPFMLAKMTQGEDGKTNIVIVEAPEHATVLVGKFVGNAYDASDNFSHCPFGVLMRAMYNQYVQDTSINHALEERDGESNEAEKQAEVPAEA